MSDVWQWQATEIAQRVKDREISAVAVTEASLDRLAAVNPSINAVVAEFPERALTAAQQIDARIGKGEEVGPLAGVPVTVKVNVDQQGHATTNGLQLQKDLVAEIDSPVVSNLENAGAVIIGRTNTPAFSMRWFTRNLLHGATLNPHNPAITPGGSSGGAAAATAAGIGAIGHGTDIAGSIRYPAYACGLHGIRPSFGRVPAVNFTAPDRNIGGQFMAVSGPMARSVDDLELGYRALSQGSPLDPWWTPVAHDLGAQPKVAAVCFNPSGLDAHPDVTAALKQAAEHLTDAGWQVDEVDCPDLREPTRMQLLLWLAEFLRGGAEAIEKEADPDALFVYENLRRHADPPDRDGLLTCLQNRVTMIREWNLFFQKYPVLLCPNSAEPPFPNHLDVESPAAFDRVVEAQVPQIGPPFLALPGLSVATGISADGVPMGVQLLAARFREDTLFAAARDLEARGPAFLPVDPR